MKKCSTSFIIREMQNYNEEAPYTSQNGHYQKFYKQMLERIWRKCTFFFLHCWWEYKLIQPLWRPVWRFLETLGIKLPCDTEIPLLGICSKKTITEKDTCTLVFIAAIFTTARTWKQPRYPSTDEWIKKLWHIYTIEYCSAIK